MAQHEPSRLHTTAYAIAQGIHSPDVRRAGRELLSLALINARNRTLELFAYFEAAGLLHERPRTAWRRAAPIWLVGHVGWFAEWWIGRNTQRSLGEECSPRPTRLASIEPRADLWWQPAPEQLRGATPPLPEQVRSYLLETLESTLEMLEHAPETDAGLYFYRLALLHEDLRGEQLIELAQWLGLPLDVGSPPLPAPRAPIGLPATRWMLGREPGGFSFAQERGRLELQVPDFEIDAQPVSWAQFAEFIEDGGYERAELWQPEGLAWLQAQRPPRRGPRHLEPDPPARQAPGRMLRERRFGRALQPAGHHPVMHLSWWEADAWARWVGRRLASEVEWEIAAEVAARRGFHWGDVHEWTAGLLRPWPGFRMDPWSEGGAFDPQFAFERARVMRGASFATAHRLRSPGARSFGLPDRDDRFCGFRTCAI